MIRSHFGATYAIVSCCFSKASFAAAAAFADA